MFKIIKSSENPGIENDDGLLNDIWTPNNNKVDCKVFNTNLDVATG